MEQAFAPTPWLFISLALVLVLAITALWIYFFYHRPLRALQRLCRLLAEEKNPRSYYVDGSTWVNEMSRDLEKIGSRLNELTRKQIEEDFNLNALLGNMVEGVMVIDQHHTIRLVNKELINLFDIKTSPLQRSVLEALREASVELLLRETMATGLPQRRELLIESHTTGEAPRCFEVSAVPIREAERRISGAVAVFHDITRIKQLETMRRDFVANVSHELRTPLAIFRGYLETLLDNPGLTQKETMRILETMQRHSNRLNALVEDLLALTRLESTHVELQLDSVKLEPFLRQLLDDWLTRFKVQPAEVHLTIADDVPVLEVDTLRLEQVFFNVLDNAVAYSNSPRKFQISACLSADKEQVEVRIKDNGIGIPPGDLPHIFERFYRVDKGRSRSSGGTGLGLSIVKHIMQIHGGAVQAESVLGHGATIILRLPAGVELEEAAL